MAPGADEAAVQAPVDAPDSVRSVTLSFDALEARLRDARRSMGVEDGSPTPSSNGATNGSANGAAHVHRTLAPVPDPSVAPAPVAAAPTPMPEAAPEPRRRRVPARPEARTEGGASVWDLVFLGAAWLGLVALVALAT